jgi:hypothetical protein
MEKTSRGLSSAVRCFDSRAKTVTGGLRQAGRYSLKIGKVFPFPCHSFLRIVFFVRTVQCIR